MVNSSLQNKILQHNDKGLFISMHYVIDFYNFII